MMDAPDLSSHLVILDVGHGNCAVAVPEPGGGVVVIDVGPGAALLEFLTSNGFNHISCIYISHADQDHIGGLIGLLSSDEVSIDRVVLNSDGMKGSGIWDDLRHELDRADNAGKLVFDVSLVNGSTDQYGEISIEILAPSKYLASGGPGSKDRRGRSVTTNSVSAVIRVSIPDNGAVLLPGDLDVVGLDDAIERGADLNCSLLVFPHHGGLPGCGIEGFVRGLIQHSNPDCVVFSNGRGRHNNPRQEIVQALQEAESPPRILCTQLAKTCSTTQAASEEHLADVFALGRADKRCCAGTIVIPLLSLSEMMPSQDVHADFIRLHVETPMCTAGRRTVH